MKHTTSKIVNILAALCFGVLVWTGVPGSATPKAWACSPPPSSANYRLHSNGELATISQPMGCMGPSGVATILSLMFMAPYSVLNLVPLIGNSVVLAGNYSPFVRRAWGITGIVMGSLGTLGSLLLTPMYTADGSSGMALWAITLLPQMLVLIANIALGARNVYLANNAPNWIPKQLSLSPYVLPGADGTVTAGTTLSFKF